MSLDEYRVFIEYDFFEFDEKLPGFSFPCCVCVHREKDQFAHPCGNCGHNIGADLENKPDDPGGDA